MGVCVGTASVNWGFDPLYTWVKLPGFTQMLDEMSAAGYAGTEISDNFPHDINALQQELTSRSLCAAASFLALNLRDRSRHEQALRNIESVASRLQTLGSDTLILSDEPSAERIAIAGRATDGDGLNEGSWKAMCDGLNRAGEALAQRAMQAVFHPHVGTFVETQSEIDRLCRSTDPALVGLCPDTGHLAYAGVNPDKVFNEYASRVRYVHLKDVDEAKLETVKRQHIDFVSAVHIGLFVELGTGMVPIDRIMSDLRSANYSGWLIVEQDAPQNPFDAARRNRNYLRTEFGI